MRKGRCVPSSVATDKLLLQSRSITPWLAARPDSAEEAMEKMEPAVASAALV